MVGAGAVSSSGCLSVGFSEKGVGGGAAAEAHEPGSLDHLLSALQ